MRRRTGSTPSCTESTATSKTRVTGISDVGGSSARRCRRKRSCGRSERRCWPRKRNEGPSLDGRRSRKATQGYAARTAALGALVDVLEIRRLDGRSP